MRFLSCNLLTAILLAGCSFLLAESPLERFVDKDIQKLNDENKAELKAILTADQPKRSPYARFNPPQPWYLWRHKNSDRHAKFILFEEYPVWEVPSEAYIQVRFLAPEGKSLATSKAAIGWRQYLKSATFRHDKTLGCNIIEVKTDPIINGADVHRQFLAVLDDRIALLRIEDTKSKLVVNDFWAPNHTIGPSPPVRSAEEWEMALSSQDSAIVLEALVWVGGIHRLDPTPSPGSYLEEVESTKLLIAVRQRPGVPKMIAKLAHSEVLWIKEAAQSALEEFNSRK